MASIEVKGYTTKAEVKESTKGKYFRCSLSEGQKQRDGSYKKVWYNITSFKSPDGPADGSKVVIKGILSMKENNGKTYFDILADGIEVLEGPKPSTDEKDPWEKK